MADIPYIFKVTAEQYAFLKSDPSHQIGGYSYYSNALYLVDANTITATYTGTESSTGTPTGLSSTIYSLDNSYNYLYSAGISSGVLTLRDLPALQSITIPSTSHKHTVTPSGTVTVTN